MSARRTEAPSIPFVDLDAQRRRIGNSIDDAIRRVLDHGRFIMGPEVAELETELARFSGVKHAITCASGTDALVIALLACGIQPGQGVAVPSFTFAATAEAVALIGAIPVFVDVLEDTFNIDPSSLEAALSRSEPRIHAIIPVDLFGLPADYGSINDLARAYGAVVIADAAQSFGASRQGVKVGGLAPVTTTSFFPAKPLGCYGDGGALFTDDDDTAAIARSVRVHGQGRNKYENVRIGINGRLDTIQAAILLEKFKVFEDELRVRQSVAARYSGGLARSATVPHVPDDHVSAWAQYTIRIDRRDDVARALQTSGIPTAIYYPVPLHAQPAYRGFPIAPGGARVSEALSCKVLSLPMHAYLEELTQARVIDVLFSARLNQRRTR